MENIDFDEIIITLYEGHYHLGVAALANSIVSADFTGLIIVGYKGELPIWVNQLQGISKNLYLLSKNIQIKFILLDVNMHFGYYKPQFLKKTFEDFPSVKKVYYFDPDIVMLAPWTFISSWVDSGVALCLDNAFPFVHIHHPWRAEWIKLASTIGLNDVNQLSYYINSGFIGLTYSDISLIERWILLTDKYRDFGGNVNIFEKDAHRAYKGDQDLLNAAITISPDINLSIIGSEGMGFEYPVYLMAHAVESVKPWKNSFFKNLIINGSLPSMAAKKYYDNCEKPIKVYSKDQIVLKKFGLKIISFLGRFIAK